MNLLILITLSTIIGYHHGPHIALLAFLIALPIIGIAELLFKN